MQKVAVITAGGSGMGAAAATCGGAGSRWLSGRHPVLLGEGEALADDWAVWASPAQTSPTMMSNA